MEPEPKKLKLSGEATQGVQDGAGGRGDHAFAALFMELPGGGSIFDRFPGKEPGLPMLSHVQDIYRIPGKSQVKFPWFMEDGSPTFVCHELNTRKQDVVVKKYIRSVCTVGLTQDARGTACACPTRGGEAPFRMLTYGTMIRACYACFERHGEKSKVKLTLERGLVVDLYDERMPSDVVNYFRDFMNIDVFHTGSSTSFLEILSATLSVDSEWKAHAARHQIPLSRSGRGEDAVAKKFDAWLQQKYPGSSAMQLSRQGRLMAVRFWKHVRDSFSEVCRLCSTPFLFHALKERHAGHAASNSMRLGPQALGLPPQVFRESLGVVRWVVQARSRHGVRCEHCEHSLADRTCSQVVPQPLSDPAFRCSLQACTRSLTLGTRPSPS
jgi:hypothetical protein